MRNKFVLLFLAPMMSCSDAAFSAEPPKRGPQGADFSGMQKMMPLMLALDADRDGSISTAEMENAVVALRKLDKNSDGVISPDELRPNPRDMAAARLPGGGARGTEKDGPAPAMLSRMFQERDANSNGKLEGDEIPERMRSMLDRIDSNGDGAIDKAEMENSAARIGDRSGQPKRGNDQGGGGVKPKRPETN